MADGDAIETYVRELEASLRRAGRPTEPLVDEARAHLYEDAARIARAEGCSDREAAERAIARFGAVGDVIRSVRRNAPVTAARVARIATVMLAVAVAWELVGIIRFHDFHLLDPDNLWVSFFAELVLVSVGLWRTLAGGRAPGWLAPALAVQAAVALTLFVMESTMTMRFAPSWTNVSIYHVLNLLQPLWLSMALQGAAGLLALRQQATQVGQPSSPVELQPPG